MSVCWSVGWLVCLSICHNSLKQREITLPCSYRCNYLFYISNPVYPGILLKIIIFLMLQGQYLSKNGKNLSLPSELHNSNKPMKSERERYSESEWERERERERESRGGCVVWWETRQALDNINLTSGHNKHLLNKKPLLMILPNIWILTSLNTSAKQSKNKYDIKT